MNTKSSQKIAVFSFLGNLMIFLHHANLCDYYPEKATPISIFVMTLFSKLAIPAMSWFFFISGYLFFRKFKPEKIMTKLKSRVRTIVVPYLIWNSFGVLLNIIKGENVLSNGIGSFILNNYIFEFGGGCANAPLWYMFRLIEFAIATPLIFLIIKHSKLFVILGGGGNTLEFN